MNLETQSQRTILLVDDAEIFRDLGKLFLSRAGRVVTAQSGEEGIELARSLRPDVMLVDLFMPGLDGDDVCRAIKSDPELRDTPVIMLVGVNDAYEWGRAVRAGADDVLAKPISRVTLNQAVNRFTRGHTPQGLPRVPIDSAVQVQVDDDVHLGRVRNLSRGGVFVETSCDIIDQTEVGLRFVLPDYDTPFDPTAQVVWHRKMGAREPLDGFGMRFVEISSALVRKLEDYVFDRDLEPGPPGAPGMGVLA
ncbi:MAG: response regulator [Myxococcota bacterium]|jgi:CheY-like chemotaxis protein/Tfp pilus assembly protein PilZ|nr:response regulator [Myxococcota bacterium]